MIEEWKDVVGYEGRYEVSNLGRVKGVDRVTTLTIMGKTTFGRRIKGVLLRPAAMKSGHLMVSLQGKSKLVHVLVIEAFIGLRPGNYTDWHCCHGDGDETNNRIDNLRWATRSDNERDKIEHGTSNRGIRNGRSKLTESQVREIKLRIVAGEEPEGIALDYKVTRGAINAIKRGRSWGWL